MVTDLGEVGIMDITIRPATEKDYDELAKLFHELNRLHSHALPHIFYTTAKTPQSLEYVRSLLNNTKATFLVAESGGKIIGFVQAVIMDAPNNPVTIRRSFVYVDDICVAAEYRRASVGKALMASVEEWGKEKGVNQVELRVWDFNRRAMAFYKSLGYEPANHIMWKTIGKKHS